MYLHSLGLAATSPRLLLALERARLELRDHPRPEEDFHHVQARLVAERLRMTPERAFSLIEGRIYTKWYQIFRRLKLFDSLPSTIERFRERGLRLGVLSDFPIRNRLNDLGLHGPWDCAFSSEETGYLKPHPRSFELLAERLGLPAGDVLYVGNSYTYDVEGAYSIGMPCAHLTAKPRLKSKAVLSFSHYDQLSRFVLNEAAKGPATGTEGVSW